jgi:hypothetical protein
MATLLIDIVTLILPFTLLGEICGFSHLPMSFLLIAGIIVTLYIIAAERAKTVFCRKLKV